MKTQVIDASVLFSEYVAFLKSNQPVNCRFVPGYKASASSGVFLLQEGLPSEKVGVCVVGDGIDPDVFYELKDGLIVRSENQDWSCWSSDTSFGVSIEAA